MGATSCPSCGFQERVVGSPPVLGLVQQNVQCLLVNSGFWELHLPAPRETRSLSAITSHCRHQVTSFLILNTFLVLKFLTCTLATEILLAQLFLLYYLLSAFETQQPGWGFVCFFQNWPARRADSHRFLCKAAQGRRAIAHQDLSSHRDVNQSWLSEQVCLKVKNRTELALQSITTAPCEVAQPSGPHPTEPTG